MCSLNYHVYFQTSEYIYTFYYHHVRKAHLNYLVCFVKCVACFLCLLIFPSSNYCCFYFMLDYVKNNTWEFVLWKFEVYQTQKIGFWEFDTSLAYITSTPSTVDDSSFSLLLLLHVYTHICTHVYITYWIYVALLVCTRVQRSRDDYCDWETSVRVYPWKNNSLFLSSHWLLVDWVDSSA